MELDERLIFIARRPIQAFRVPRTRDRSVSIFAPAGMGISGNWANPICGFWLPGFTGFVLGLRRGKSDNLKSEQPERSDVAEIKAEKRNIPDFVILKLHVIPELECDASTVSRAVESVNRCNSSYLSCAVQRKSLKICMNFK